MLFVYVRLVVGQERDGWLKVFVRVQLQVFWTVAFEQLVDVDVEELWRVFGQRRQVLSVAIRGLVVMSALS